MRIVEDIVIGSMLDETKDEKRRTRIMRFEDVAGPDYLATVANSTECPKMGNGFPAGRGYTGAVIDRKFKHPGNKKSVVSATIVYSNKATANDGQGGGGQQQPQIISLNIGSVLVPVQAELDYLGRPMCVSYSPSGIAPEATYSATKDKDDRIIFPCKFADYDVLQRVEITIRETYNPWWADSYINTTNSKPMWGAGAGTLWVEHIGGPCQFPPGVEIPSNIQFDNKYVIIYNPKGFLKLGVYFSPRLGGVPSNVEIKPKKKPKIDLTTRDSEDSGIDDTRLKAGNEYGNGWGIFRIKGESDLNGLKLPRIDVIGTKTRAR